MKKKLFSITKDDFEVQTFRAGGKGGQNQNKRDTGVRVIHTASGARGEARDERSQHQNKMEALRRLTKTPQFKVWLMKEVAHYDGKPTAEELAEEMMRPENLRVETRGEKGWVEATEC